MRNGLGDDVDEGVEDETKERDKTMITDEATIRAGMEQVSM